jgi:hypothetical protein
MVQGLSEDEMNPETTSIDERLRTPRAAAIAGIVFSLLFTASLLLVWVSVPENPLGPATAVIKHLKILSFSLNLLPFAGIAFLWFIAVVRDRLGQREDRFFATVFFGSGLLFIAMVFNAATTAAGIIKDLGSGSENLIQNGIYALSRIEIQQSIHIYAMKMAALFMTTISRISLRTRVFPRWMAFLGYVLALTLLMSVGTIEWIPLVFPLWVLLISVYILAENLHGPSESAA